jgi:hypothetical protein
MISFLLWVLSAFPTIDDANQAVAATLPDRDECDVDLRAQPYDCPEYVRWALLTISNREGPDSWSAERHWVGIHTGKGDHRHSAKIGRYARRIGRYSDWCPWHWGDEGHSTVGPHGMMIGYTVQRLGAPGNCVPWWLFGMPNVSARVALSLYLDRCADGVEGFGWCVRTERVVATRRRWYRRRRLRDVRTG